MAAKAQFKPALIIVDFQEDFCPPNGSLAVPEGRSIGPPINTLLALPFVLKIATRDWHPTNHVSFAANHPGAQPYTSSYTIAHPTDSSLNYTTTLWPVHCVQDTPGAQLVPELDVSRLDAVIDKGQNPSVEMYSAFRDPSGVSVSGLKDKLKEGGVTDVFVVGLASDYCVRATAEHALEEGFRTFIVEEATKAVVADKWQNEGIKEVMEKGVKVVSMEGEEVARVKALA